MRCAGFFSFFHSIIDLNTHAAHGTHSIHKHPPPFPPTLPRANLAQVYDKDKITKDDYMGTAVFSFSKVSAGHWGVVETSCRSGIRSLDIPALCLAVSDPGVRCV